ncbi:MAG: phytanoyl-CoA dioxygenase family protein [Candidatus Hydrogenedentes bacterium]|nr:phytanoyl-CoA dioxygenase family protein [Candidatus Hydrogenedentota bacterium]
MPESASRTTPEDLSEQQLEEYRLNGFIHVPNIITKDEAAEFHRAALDYAEEQQSICENPVFGQWVNVWRQDDEIRRLTLHPNVGAVAAKLAGVPLRLWHDHILIKRPRNQVATEFHQDQPYWPHATSPNSLSAWIALCDVPVERGCMSFIPGSHRHVGLEAQDLLDATSLFGKCPELQWEPRVTVPLRAGDCTFHHSCCAHMATPNVTGDPRVAHVVIFMDTTTTYMKKSHIVTDPLGLEEGALLEGELFPPV